MTRDNERGIYTPTETLAFLEIFEAYERIPDRKPDDPVTLMTLKDGYDDIVKIYEMSGDTITSHNWRVAYHIELSKTFGENTAEEILSGNTRVIDILRQAHDTFPLRSLPPVNSSVFNTALEHFRGSFGENT